MSENNSITGMTDPVVVAVWDTLPDRKPAGALVENTDLVVIRYDESSSVLYGRCRHSTESLWIPITVTLHVNGDLCKSVKSVAYLPWAGESGHRFTRISTERGAKLADGFVDDHDTLICGVHNWDYRIDSGVSEYKNGRTFSTAGEKEHVFSIHLYCA